MNKYVLHPKLENSATFSVRVKSELLSHFNALSDKTGRSRNELINLAMNYFIDSVEVRDDSENYSQDKGGGK